MGIGDRACLHEALRYLCVVLVPTTLCHSRPSSHSTHPDASADWQLPWLLHFGRALRQCRLLRLLLAGAPPTRVGGTIGFARTSGAPRMQKSAATGHRPTPVNDRPRLQRCRLTLYKHN